MASVVGIANIGLTAIGQTNITSLTQGTKTANAVNTIYDELRRNMLVHPWNFATVRAQLARSATAPTYEFNYAYVLPSDHIRTISVHNNDEGVGTIYYKEEQVNDQRVILSDDENVYLRYVKDEDDPNLMPADFRYALSMAIARDLAIPIASSTQLYETYSNIATRALNKAKSTDALGNFPERRPSGSWVTSRSGWPTRNSSYSWT